VRPAAKAAWRHDAAGQSIAVVDARQWQNIFDLRTGGRLDAAGPAVTLAQDVLKAHPYPGDMDPAGNRWVTDVAVELVDRYDPRFVFLTYAHQYFSGRYTAMTAHMRSNMIEAAFAEGERFIRRTGFTPVIVGTGDMTPLIDTVDASRLDGLAVSTHWSARYAGLYEPSRKDLDSLAHHPFIQRVVPRGEIVRLFDGTPEQAQRVPEYLLVAKEGYGFRAMGSTLRKPVMVPSAGFHIPVGASGEVKSITGISGLIKGMLKENRVALIVMEGIGVKGFAGHFSAAENGKDWYYYEPGDAQYLTITTGEHRFFDYPTGYRYFEDMERREFPFSGYFRSIPQGTLAAGFPGRSIAVGNKSMFMHMVTGADICVECFARNLYNQGTMAVIHRDDKF
jgi:hypothetical protein